jgi:hypothetical protein
MAALVIKNIAGGSGEGWVVVSGNLPAGNSVEIRDYVHAADTDPKVYDGLPADAQGNKYVSTVFTY